MMSATLPVPFATMEDPLGDTMEMASPYPGNADDFEIDLDIMEDQPFNADNDLDVVDASPDALNQTEPSSTIGQPPNDAVMLDEVPEQPMINAFQHGSEAHPTDNMFYQGQETYESEMLDDEYDEDIDAPLPNTKDGTVTNDAQTLNDGEGIFSTQHPPEDHNLVQGKGQELYTDTKEEEYLLEDNGTLETQENQEETDARDAEQTPIGNANDERYRASEQDNQQTVTNNAAHIGSEQSPVPGDTENQPIQEGKGQVDETDNTINPGSEHEGQLETHNHGETREEPFDESQNIPHIHSVKVLYQDSEISLFPPQEGDSSETFFLEDEGLAHENLGKLLASCRQVLGEHVDDDEVLVIDIESLNLQLSEDSLHISQVTLVEIVELYLHLCRNDGVDDPDPLYVTLSTKLTLPSEISNLTAAANEGKGISSIPPWEDYGQDDGENNLGDGNRAADIGVVREEAQEQSKSVTETTTSSNEGHDGDVPQPDRVPQDQIIFLEAASKRDSRQPDSGKTDNVRDSDRIDGAAVEAEADHNPSLSREQDHRSTLSTHINDGQHKVEDGAKEIEDNGGDNNGDEENGDDGAGDEVEDKVYEASQVDYDSEEQTESTATLAHSSLTHSDEQQRHDAAEGCFDQDYSSPSDYDHHVGHETGEALIEGEEEADAEDPGRYNQEIAAGLSDQTASHEETTAEQDVHDQAVSPAHNELSSDQAQDTTADYEQLDVVTDEYDYTQEIGHSHSQQHLDFKGDETHVSYDSRPAKDTRKTPEPAEDLLGIDEDLFASPFKISDRPRSTAARQESNNISGHAGEASNTLVESASSADGSADEYEQLNFDEEDYFDLGDAESVGEEGADDGFDEHQSPTYASRKRSREPEDEVDLIQTPTPDIKRSRSA